MKNSLLIVTILLCSNWALGQNKATKIFSGDFEGGTATYSYYENNNYERIYNGEFGFSGSAERYDGLKVSIKGNFTNNLRDGKWTFSVSNTKSPVIMVLSDKEIAMMKLALRIGSYSGNISQKYAIVLRRAIYNGSIQVFQTYNSTLSGNYTEGKLNGVWTYKEVSTGVDVPEMINKENLSVSSTVTFKENHLIGNFIFKYDKNNYVLGQFDNSGAIDGKWFTKWVSDGNEYENISEYKKGTLIKMIERNASTGDIISQDTQAESKGQKLMARAILFWIKDVGKEEFNQLPISSRNYMYKFDRGITKPINPFNIKLGHSDLLNQKKVKNDNGELKKINKEQGIGQIQHLNNGISYRLGSRGIKYFDKPNASFDEQGTVVLIIWVNQGGKVVNAQVSDKGTTVVNEHLRNIALHSALNSTFVADSSAPARQIGTITYHFILKK